MPYFVFTIEPEGKPEFINQFDKFLDAKKAVRHMREDQEPGDPSVVKMVFAKSVAEGKRLLTEKREAPPKGMEHEF